MKLPSGQSLAILLALTASQASLKAESLSPMTFGAELAGSSPLQDLRAMTPKTGVGLGLFAELPFNETAIIQTRFSVTRFATTQPPLASSPVQASPFHPAGPLSLAANSAAVAVEIRQYLPLTQAKRIFILAGVTAMRYEFRSAYRGTAVDQNGITLPGVHEAKVKTSTKAALSAGLGYDFQGAALSLRYITLPMDGHNLATLETGFSFRF